MMFKVFSPSDHVLFFSFINPFQLQNNTYSGGHHLCERSQPQQLLGGSYGQHHVCQRWKGKRSLKTVFQVSGCQPCLPCDLLKLSNFQSFCVDKSCEQFSPRVTSNVFESETKLELALGLHCSQCSAQKLRSGNMGSKN